VQPRRLGVSPSSISALDLRARRRGPSRIALGVGKHALRPVIVVVHHMPSVMSLTPDAFPRICLTSRRQRIGQQSANSRSNGTTLGEIAGSSESTESRPNAVFPATTGTA